MIRPGPSMGESEVIVNKRYRPTESTDFLLNPHKGCATFQRFNGDTLFPGKSWSESGPTEFPPAEREVAENYLPCTVAYCRWFWDLVQPEANRFDWTPVERALETAHDRGHCRSGRRSIRRWCELRWLVVSWTCLWHRKSPHFKRLYQRATSMARFTMPAIHPPVRR